MASSSSSSPVALSKRGRPRNSGAKNPVFCSVDGCASDLNQCREYHRRHKVCERHSKTPVVLVGGKKPQFCQHCSGCKKIIREESNAQRLPCLSWLENPTGDF
ncbi:orf102a (mitochondrion) [Beta vulgaris subsp. vulgaris]|uniref:Orf102a protein n=3 Tax=Beta TaxID=3554 RepID=Q9MF81_BETVV|nr:orf102a [Beta vulgaris subsp. vulgaris]YP_004222254.1 hypothetical protein LKY74_mgp150 [Beta vulgaris subsp. maritima]YP_004842061.1 hypothetical protein LKY79_mgp148 [Beta macrocarpa]CBJ14085.1 hypothetical protein [Beta vulgaris subsp. maritima]CBJ17494.1 hypothetical protein [Beta vulgaris subsp. maritima]CBL52064.1 hypothetical protein [Beta vulgaris subsp. maritima]CBX24866.1 hypothetical protein [Beta macrocarpa]BAA99452.1 orf102a [Beta vulgaris subsp. vulgaris]